MNSMIKSFTTKKYIYVPTAIIWIRLMCTRALRRQLDPEGSNFIDGYPPL